MATKINLAEKPATFADHWSPRTVAQLNDARHDRGAVVAYRPKYTCPGHPHQMLAPVPPPCHFPAIPDLVIQPR